MNTYTPIPLEVSLRRWVAWAKNMEGAQLEVLPDASIQVRRAPDGVSTRIVPADVGYLVTDDGTWPVVFDDFELASAVARMRQKLRASTHSEQLFRGEPCWLVEDCGSVRYPHINVSERLVDAMGMQRTDYSTRRCFRRIAAHRVSFFVFNGHRPMKGTVEHACHTRKCSHPAHLDDMTQEENNRSGAAAEALRRESRKKARR